MSLDFINPVSQPSTVNAITVRMITMGSFLKKEDSPSFIEVSWPSLRPEHLLKPKLRRIFFPDPQIPSVVWAVNGLATYPKYL